MTTIAALLAIATLNQTPSIPLTISGGYDTDRRDGGRPVILIASALGVTSDVFREAFSHVRPAPAGQEPDPAQVRQNKDALMRALKPYGVTNNRLDEVSNYYRYNGRRGEIWRNTPATATITLANRKVAAIKITNPGNGYTVPPTITLKDHPALRFKATLFFGKDLMKNGSIETITQVLPR